MIPPPKGPLLLPIPKACVAFCVLVATAWAGSGEVESIPQIGSHQPILIVEKNVHPQNKMVVYTKLDASGRFMADPAARDRPMLDFYWLMDGTNYKPVNGRIKNEIRKRFTGEWNPGSQAETFTVSVNDLKEVNTDIRDPKLEIHARETGDGTNVVEAQMKLSPSDGNKRIKLSSIYTEGRAFHPAVDSVILHGEEIVNGNLTGRKVTRRYNAVGRTE